MMQPGMQQPGMMQPGMQQPGFQQPVYAQPGTDSDDKSTLLAPAQEPMSTGGATTTTEPTGDGGIGGE